MSSAVAEPRFVMANECLLDTPAAPDPYPLLKPAWSISQAAEVFTVPSRWL